MMRLLLDNKTDVINQIRDYLEMSAEAKFIHRLQAILLFAESEKGSCNGVGASFGNSPRSVSNWVKRINRTGTIESLRSKPQSGRPTRLSQAQRVEIKTVLQDLPEKQGMSGRRWGGKNLSSYIRLRYGIEMEIRTCQRLLKELGISSSSKKADKSTLK
jgi:Transposase and inactivated derivatives